MCTTISGQASISGSGKNGSGWFRVDRAVVGYDHPNHAPLEHALLLDVTGESAGSPRLAVELSLESARRLAELLAETVRQAEEYERTLDTRAAAPPRVATTPTVATPPQT